MCGSHRSPAGRDMGGLGGGLAFGLLPAVQFYLQEGRPYALVAAGAGISTLLLVTALQGRARMLHWVAYGSILLACGLLNWLSLMILPAHLMTLFWTRATFRVFMCWGPPLWPPQQVYCR